MHPNITQQSLHYRGASSRERIVRLGFAPTPRITLTCPPPPRSCEAGRRLLRLQEIFQSLRPARASFQIQVVRRVESALDALNFLKGVEKNNR
ncbi:hypothetical protein E2C01_061551 [Portunus trituberculatus]|uniref:Uncharacterized protein n=1 Tax=Portunus trituberculatus TaxID=210409 RepID=A0A5B7HBK4_PORTR|nr:hypothetical protein [Portunus trituberculatus]